MNTKISKCVMGLLALASIPASSFAAEVCEIGTSSFRIQNFGDDNQEVVSLNCTNLKGLRGVDDFVVQMVNNDMVLIVSQRPRFKKKLIEAGYRVSSKCSTVETFIKL